jgi:hypothetical protein
VTDGVRRPSCVTKARAARANVTDHAARYPNATFSRGFLAPGAPGSPERDIQPNMTLTRTENWSYTSDLFRMEVAN